MPTSILNKFVVGISSRALFNLDESNVIFEKKGVDSYAKYQIERENEVLEPGAAFQLVQKFLNLNKKTTMVEVILLSRNSADTGLRIFNSIEHYGLNITRAAFSSGKSPYKYIQAFGAHLFLSTNPDDVKNALRAGCAAATIISKAHHRDGVNFGELKIAFDGDSVLFSDESERIFQTKGLDAFSENERFAADQPLTGGPFKGFLMALQLLQKRFSENTCPIRTALVTARQAPAHIRIDEALFLGGLEKTDFLRAFEADIFFDDQAAHCESASKHVATGHVPNGITNELSEQKI